jgi:hypothetical protein
MKFEKTTAAVFMTDKAYPTVDQHILGVYPRFLRFLYDLHAIHNRPGVTDIPGSMRLVGVWRPQGMPVPKIAEVGFTSADRVRDVVPNFNNDGFDSLYPKYAGGRPKTFTLLDRREIEKVAKSTPTEHDLPFPTWRLTELDESWSPRG